MFFHGQCSRLYALHPNRRTTAGTLFTKEKKSAQLAEQSLGSAVTAGCRLFQPVEGRSSVRAYSESVQITTAQAKLSITVIALRRCPVFFYVLRNIRHLFHRRPLPKAVRSAHVQSTGSSQTSYQQRSAAQSFPAVELLPFHTWGRYYHELRRLQADFPTRAATNSQPTHSKLQNSHSLFRKTKIYPSPAQHIQDLR